MAGFVADAAGSADLRGACGRAGVSLILVRRCRHSDPIFDAAMCDVDEAVRLATIESVKAAAATGHLKSIQALVRGDLESFGLTSDGAQEPVVVEKLASIAPRVFAGECPHCGHGLELAAAAEDGAIVLGLIWAEYPRDPITKAITRVIHPDLERAIFGALYTGPRHGSFEALYRSHDAAAMHLLACRRDPPRDVPGYGPDGRDERYQTPEARAIAEREDES